MSAPTVSEFVRDKAERLLTSGCVEVACGENGLTATVTGDHGRYLLVREPDRWRCTCPARTERCSHVIALERVAA
jgi:hypothetical protein